MGVTEAGGEEEIAEMGIRTMEDFYRRIGMPTNLKELGVCPTEEQIQEMAERCIKACGGHTGSAKKLTIEDMVSIYKAANDN